MNTDNDGRFFLRVGVACLLVAAASIGIANVIGELNDVAWLLLVPIGLLGGVTAGLGSLGLYAVRRRA